VTSARVAIVQGECDGDFTSALERTADLAADAGRQGAALVAFPETWIPCYPVWFDVCRDIALWDHAPAKELHARYGAASVDVNGESGARLGRIAKALSVTLVVGVSEQVRAGPGRGTLYNSLLTYARDGRLANHHRKLMPTYSERMVWGAGDAEGLRAIETESGRVGGLICWEHWMPLARQALHQSGEDVHVAAWPTAHERNQIASRHYAFEGRCFVLVACSVMRARALPPEFAPHPTRVSGPEDWVIRGGSAVVGPDGEYVEAPRYDGPCTIVTDLALDRVRAESMTLDVAGHYSRPDCLTLTVHTGRSTRSGP
jgi:predicted amidohydrolase